MFNETLKSAEICWTANTHTHSAMPIHRQHST